MEESKEVDPEVNQEVTEAIGSNHNDDADEADEPEHTDSANADALAASSATKKKKSKKAKLKKAMGVGVKDDGTKDGAASSSSPASKLTSGMVEQLLEMNPSLKSEVAGMDKTSATEKLKKLDVADLLTGMVCSTNVLVT